MIIFSTVRANSQMKANLNEQNLIGFLNDVRRLNVAITRAKFVLIILGALGKFIC